MPILTKRKAWTPLASPLKWHGGKSYLADWIVSLFPSRCATPNKPKDEGWLHYVEPYFGGGAVMLANDPQGISEVVNDLHGGLSNFWNVLRNVRAFEEFNRAVNMTEFSQALYHAPDAVPSGLSPKVHLAWKFFVQCRQSLAGRMRSFASVTRNRTRQGMNEQVSAWLSAVEGLPLVHKRMKRVLVLCGDALEVIRREDGSRTLFYLDPPYLHETRTTKKTYDHEMSAAQHRDLLTLLNSIRGRFLLSGYHSAMYDEWAYQSNFNCYEMKIDNKASGAASKRVMTECVWTNYDSTGRVF